MYARIGFRKLFTDLNDANGKINQPFLYVVTLCRNGSLNNFFSINN